MSKSYFLNLAQQEIYMLERQLTVNRKYKNLERRLAYAKQMKEWLEKRFITIKKKKKPKNIPPETRKLIKQHLRNGEKQQWIVATCKVSIGTVTALNREVKKEKKSITHLQNAA